MCSVVTYAAPTDDSSGTRNPMYRTTSLPSPSLRPAAAGVKADGKMVLAAILTVSDMRSVFITCKIMLGHKFLLSCSGMAVTLKHALCSSLLVNQGLEPFKKKKREEALMHLGHAKTHFEEALYLRDRTIEATKLVLPSARNKSTLGKMTRETIMKYSQRVSYQMDVVNALNSIEGPQWKTSPFGNPIDPGLLHLYVPDIQFGLLIKIRQHVH